jgi:hypothetical protein
MRSQGGGTTPYGWRVEIRKELVPVPDEQAVLWLIAHMRSLGWSLGRMADRLEELGIQTRAGVPFSRQTLHQTLRRLPAAGELKDTG